MAIVFDQNARVSELISRLGSVRFGETRSLDARASDLRLGETQATRSVFLIGRLDAWLMFAVIALSVFGVVMVASSSIAIAEGDGLAAFHYLKRHLVFILMGVSFGYVFYRLPLALLDRYSRLALLLAIGLLLLVFVPGLGHRVNGATRWLNLGLSKFQAVEAVKVMLIIWLASYLVRFSKQVQGSVIGILKPIGIAGIVIVLLLQQPDFGSAMLLLAIVGGMIWLAGARLFDLGVFALMALPPILWVALSEGYRVKRLKSFLNPWADPFNDGFQLTQALIAIGRGEWFGVGLGASVQKLFYLPEAHTDFILAVIAEELGLFGIVLVLSLFALLVSRLFAIGLRAQRVEMPFAAYLIFGIGIWIAVQSMVSIGVNLGVLPTKGLTLPLISSGGSSLMMTLAAMGLALRISAEVDQAERQRQRDPNVQRDSLRTGSSAREVQA